MVRNYDAIVLGVGSMGASSCYYLARQGYKVLGIEQFDISHDLGSHAGQSRIIRKAYFEHPDYVPLLERAYQNWQQIEKERVSQIYFPTGLLYAGKSGETLIKGVLESAKKYNINVESISHQQIKVKYPQFNLPEDYDILFEAGAGFVTPERAILCYVEQAIKSGATIHTKEKALDWKKHGEEITVVTSKATYTCSKLIITAGPWSSELIEPFSKSFKVTRQVIAWMNTNHIENYLIGNFPCWMMDDASQDGMFYGFPVLPVGKFGGPVGLKFALHYPGDVTSPNEVNRLVTKDEETLLINAMNKFLPSAYHSTHVLKTCLYTNSPDENFIIDFLPGYNQQVIIAAGFSGHGFKFASAVGDVLAELAIKGKTDLPIKFLSLNRFIS